MAFRNQASRRAFLKAIAVTGAVAAAAVELFVGCGDDDDDGGYGYGYGQFRRDEGSPERLSQLPLTNEEGAGALATFRESYDRRRRQGSGPWSPGRGPASARDLG